MKKFFTLFACALCALVANAQTRTTLWEGSITMDGGWPSITIPAEAFASARVGDKIVVTVDKADNTINKEWQWGPQVFINVDWKNMTDQVTGTYTDGATNFEHVCEITAGGLEHLRSGSEVEVQGMNVIISKVELESAIETKSTTIWEGECSFGNWADGFSIEADKFVSANAGDVIEFIYTTDSSNPNTWWQFKTIYSGTEETLEGNKSDLNSYGCATVANGSTIYKITLTETDVTNLKEKGLFVNGYYNIVTKVNLIQPADASHLDAVSATQAKDTVRYNLSGQKVGNDAKLFISNGKIIMQR